MVGVGLLAAHLGGRALWAVPLSFVTMMVAGGTAGLGGMALPFVEIGIGLSIVVLGPAVAFSLHLPTMVAMALVGLFAIFHGHAHGVEMPESASGFEYALGFVAATAGLHGCGIGLGLILGKDGRSDRRSHFTRGRQRHGTGRPCHSRRNYLTDINEIAEPPNAAADMPPARNRTKF